MIERCLRLQPEMWNETEEILFKSHSLVCTSASMVRYDDFSEKGVGTISQNQKELL